MDRRSPLCRWWLLLPACLLLMFSDAPLNAASPELRTVRPAGAQRGTEATFVLRGARLHDAQEILFYKPGITVTELEAVEHDRVRAMLRIAEDCPLGEHPFRIRTATGITELRTLWVGQFPTVSEEDPNSDFHTPQAVDLNVTIEGRITNEDVDFFIFEARQGQRITVEVEGIRLANTMFDPYAAIFDQRRFEVAANDDSILLLQDPLVQMIAPEDGSYIVQVREAAYGGNNQSFYRLHLGTYPRPTVAFPPGGPAGETMDVKLLGDIAGPLVQSLTLPDEPTDHWPIFAEQNGLLSPSPVHFRVSDMPNVLESPPNNNRGQATVYEGSLPVAFNGIIREPGEQDWYAFTAKKDQPVDIEVYARRVRSPLDPVLNIFNAERHLQGNADSRGLDSYVRFTPPEDGQYFIRIRDHLGRGGDDFVYRVEVTPVTADLSLSLPIVNRRNPQERQTVSIPQGNRAAMLIRASRNGFNGPVAVELSQLPQGVQMDCDHIAGNVDVVPVVFSAAEDAPIAGGLFPVQGRHTDENSAIRGALRQEIPLVLGSPNQTVYYTTTVNGLPVAVTERAPFAIRIVEPRAPLVQDGSLPLKIVAEREEGFNAPIHLEMLWNPPGVSSAANMQLPQGESEVIYPLNAAGNAPTRSWRIAVIGRADTGNGQVWVSTQLATLRVAEPFVTGTLEMAATEQGQPAGVLCRIDQRHPFEGEATLRLLGLPPKTATEEARIGSDAEEHVFTVTTEPDAPRGQHRSLFAEVQVMVEGEPVVHRFSQQTVLRIDRPRVAREEPKQEEQAKAEEKEPQEPAPRPLSRLEQLRQQRQ